MKAEGVDPITLGWRFGGLRREKRASYAPSIVGRAYDSPWEKGKVNDQYGRHRRTEGLIGKQSKVQVLDPDVLPPAREMSTYLVVAIGSTSSLFLHRNAP